MSTPPRLVRARDRAIARGFTHEAADLSLATRQAVDALPERWARKFNVLPLTLTDRALVVATADPLDMDCERTLAFATGRDIVLRVAAPDAIARRIDELYRPDAAPPESERIIELHLLDADHELMAPQTDAESTVSVSRLVDRLIADGIAARASDVHIEPEERGIAVRHRIDGVLKLDRTLSRSVGPSLVSRIKIMSGLDIADRLRPQDGGARVAVNGVAVDLRVSTLPASHGEKVVIRVLDSNGSIITLDAMSFDAAEHERLTRLLDSREGLILVTGPTGSGKTTTLYAALRELRQKNLNIVTVEDPIEYRLPGIVQVQVNEKAGLTFASALRSIMRQDPDVLLIGEVRDRETAEIAIQASLTGHLVLSTLHTNDAASAVARLVDIGVAPYKIATALKGIIAQRLVRRLCSECDGTPGELRERCATCRGSGFRGRLPIAEILISSPEFGSLITEGASLDRLQTEGRRTGMRTLWESGTAHVAAGRTTSTEVARVATAARSRDQEFDQTVPVRRVAEAAVLPLEPRRQPRMQLVTPGAAPVSNLSPMAELKVGTIAVIVLARRSVGWRVLLLERAGQTRSPGMWEIVHGRIEAGEEPETAAVREVREETGLRIERLYNVMVYPFYLHKTHTVELSVVFAGLVEGGDGDPDPAVQVGSEHGASAWLSPDDARARLHWPRVREALDTALALLDSGDAGIAEDVLRVL